MPDNRKRKRPIQVKFLADEKEPGMIKEKMAQAKIISMNAYIRKMIGPKDMPYKRICLRFVN